MEEVAVSVAWVHVASVAPETIDTFVARLPVDERERAARYRFPKDRNLFVLARTLARHMLTEIAGERTWTFAPDAHGKLAIAPPFGDPALHFNVSHTDGVVAGVVARGIAVGIDVEGIDRELDFSDMTHATFAPEEREAFTRCTDDARPEFFFATWTLKEAIAKARGIGLGMPFPETCLALEPAPRVLRDPAGDVERWSLTSFAPLPSHRLSVALRTEPGAVTAFDVREVSVETLLER